MYGSNSTFGYVFKFGAGLATIFPFETLPYGDEILGPWLQSQPLTRVFAILAVIYVAMDIVAAPLVYWGKRLWHKSHPRCTRSIKTMKL